MLPNVTEEAVVLEDPVLERSELVVPAGGGGGGGMASDAEDGAFGKVACVMEALGATGPETPVV